MTVMHAKAGELPERHLTGDHAGVCGSDPAVLACDRWKPVIPPANAAPEASETWRIMQIIERNRHLAQLLEVKAATSKEGRLWLGIATQRRELADQLDRLSGERPLNELSRLPLG